MDAFRGIPNLVADIIARIIPGSLMLFAATYALNFNAIEVISSRFTRLQDNTVLVAALVLVMAFVVGSLIDSLGSNLWDRYVHRLGLSQRVLEQAIRQPGASRYPPVVLQELQREFLENISTELEPHRFDPESKGLRKARGMNKDRFYVATYLMYDWLTMYKPGAGARASKFFAEHIMFRSIATVAMLTLAAHIIGLLFQIVAINWTIVAISLIVAVGGLLGVAQRFYTFQILVIQQYYVARKWSNPDSDSDESQDSKPD